MTSYDPNSLFGHGIRISELEKKFNMLEKDYIIKAEEIAELRRVLRDIRTLFICKEDSEVYGKAFNNLLDLNQDKTEKKDLSWQERQTIRREKENKDSGDEKEIPHYYYNAALYNLKKDCNKCKLYGECDHQGAYKKDGKWCYEDSKPPKSIEDQIINEFNKNNDTDYVLKKRNEPRETDPTKGKQWVRYEVVNELLEGQKEQLEKEHLEAFKNYEGYWINKYNDALFDIVNDLRETATSIGELGDAKLLNDLIMKWEKIKDE